MDDTLRIIAVGDLSFNAAYHRLLAEQGVIYPFHRVVDQWKDAAIRFGNLESPIASSDRVAPAKLTLRGSPLTPESLAAAGFDCVSLANNHMMDFGPSGLSETCERLDMAGIARVGAGRNLAEAMAPRILNRGGRSVGVLAFCDVEQVSNLYATANSPGVAPIRIDACRDAIASLRKQVDWIVVHAHWGVEMSRLPSPTQRHWARVFIGAGANVILGHHPHVIQPVETIDAGLAAYSLGDFTFSNTFWHGVNGGGNPFLAHYEVHQLSRRTGWLQIDLAAGRAPVARFRPAVLKRNLTVVPQDKSSRHREWRRLTGLLQHSNYAELFEAESRPARRRGRWRMERRLFPRLRLKLLQYGLSPGVGVEPDGHNWRARHCRS